MENVLQIVKRLSKRIDISLKGSKKNCYLLKNPCDLSVVQRETLFKEFFPMTLAAYRQTEDYLWFREAVWERMFQSGFLLLFFDGDKGVAFKGYDEMLIGNKKVTYVGVISVDVEYQGNGINQALYDVFSGDTDYMVARTQNPIVATVFLKKFGRVYPFSGDPNDEVKSISHAVCQAHNSLDGYDYHSMVARGIYNNRPLNNPPYRIDNGIQEKMDYLLDPYKGDAVMIVSPLRDR